MEIKRHTIDVDFTQPGIVHGHNVLFNIIRAHNGSGKSKNTASTLINTAYSLYNKAFTPAMVIALENELKAKHILDKYDINDKDSFFKSLQQYQGASYHLKKPYKRLIILHEGNTPSEDELIRTLIPLRMRERCDLIYKVLWQYLVVTEDSLYIDMISDLLVCEISNYYKELNYESDKLLDSIIDGILAYLPKPESCYRLKPLPNDIPTDIETYRRIWGPSIVVSGDKNKK